MRFWNDRLIRYCCVLFAAALSACSTAGTTSTDPNSGLVVRYPRDASCPTVVSYFDDWNGPAGRRRYAIHKGLDIPVPIGTPIRAIADGDVVVLKPNQQANGKSWGMSLYVQHSPADFGASGDKTELFFQSRYVHVEKNTLVNIGDRVKKGQIIAYSGPHDLVDHLHFTIKTFTKLVNPFFIYSEKFDGLNSNSKFVEIPYTDGTRIFPKNARVIWPIACKKDS